MRVKLGCLVALAWSAGLVVWAAEGDDWPTRPTVGWFTPGLYFNGAVGASSAEHVEDLAVAHHDPTRADGTVQGLELGVSMRAHKHLEGFATYTLHYGAEEEWEGEWEEMFLKLADLPGGFEIRGGRMLARFGAQNATHLHSWDFVDMPLAAGMLLGEDGLGLDGGDLMWAHRDRELSYGVILGYGEVRTHDHGHEADQDADHEAEHNADPADEDDHDHDDVHGWEDMVGYGRAFAIYQPHDFIQWTVGSSAALGDNEEAETRGVYGIDLTYQWREHGWEPGGRAVRWTTEVFVTSEKAGHAEHGAEEHAEDGHEEGMHDHTADSLERETEFGAYTQALYSWNDRFESGLRFGYVEGGDHGNDRYRVSPVATYRPLGTPAVALRVQYNYDEWEQDSEHTVWAQLGLAWGGAEVR